MNIYIILAILLISILLFFMYVGGFVLGIKHGKQVKQGVIPKVNPVKAVVETIEEHKVSKVEKKLEEDLIDAMSYTKETALEAIKKAK